MAQVALTVLTGDQPLAELAQRYELRVKQNFDRKTQMRARATQVFDGPRPQAGLDLKALHGKLGQLPQENDFLEGALSKAEL
jgi:hypothetical protein